MYSIYTIHIALVIVHMHYFTFYSARSKSWCRLGSVVLVPLMQ
jgi:hypothetical protein